jgi:hypothetical protein
MRKPILGNIQILNLKHLFRENKDWKPMASLKVHLHLANIANKEKINM